MHFLRRSLGGLVLVAITLAALGLAAGLVRGAMEARKAQGGGTMSARERVFAVNVVTVEPATIAPMIEVFGELRARRALEVRAEVGGRIVRLGEGFEEGGRVEAGALLLAVDPANLEDARALAETDLAEARAERRDAAAALEIARDDLASAEAQAGLRAQALTRQRDLATRGVGTEAAVETAALAAAAAEQAVLSRRSALAQAEARVATADNSQARREIALEEAARRLAETRVTAQFAGRLSGVTAVEGRIVTANEQLATLIDPDALEVRFRLSLAQYARLIDADGRLMPADVTAKLAVSGVALTAPGKIDRESAEVGDGQTGRLLFARLGAAPGLRPGDFVSVEITTPAIDGLARLPASALGPDGTVLVLGAEDRLEAAAVELVHREGDSVLVRAPALAGRDVVAERSPVLGAGIQVRANRAGEAPAPDPGAAAGGGGTGAGMGAGQGGGGVGGVGGGETIVLDPDRRARLVAFVKKNPMMPEDAKARILKSLEAEEVPAAMVERLEGRMGG